MEQGNGNAGAPALGDGGVLRGGVRVLEVPA